MAVRGVGRLRKRMKSGRGQDGRKSVVDDDVVVVVVQKSPNKKTR